MSHSKNSNEIRSYTNVLLSDHRLFGLMIFAIHSSLFPHILQLYRNGSTLPIWLWLPAFICIHLSWKPMRVCWWLSTGCNKYNMCGWYVFPVNIWFLQSKPFHHCLFLIGQKFMLVRVQLKHIFPRCICVSVSACVFAIKSPILIMKAKTDQVLPCLLSSKTEKWFLLCSRL